MLKNKMIGFKDEEVKIKTVKFLAKGKT